MSKRNRTPIVVSIPTTLTNWFGSLSGMATEIKDNVRNEYICSKGEALLESEIRMAEARKQYAKRLNTIRTARHSK